MSNRTYCQRNKDMIRKRAKDYYNNDKERLTNFQPMFDLCRNQVVGFYYQNV